MAISYSWQNLRRSLIPWLVPLGIVILWQVLCELGFIPTRILPAPTKVLESAVRLTLSGELILNVGISFRRAAMGFVIGGGIGFLLGILNGLFIPAERLLDTTLQMIRNIPNLALIPLAILWFGIGEESRLFLVSLGVFFPIYVNTFFGIRSIEPGLIEVGRVYGLDRWGQITQVVLPGALPAILVGLRYALGIMWLTLIVAETIAANSGIGYMAMNAREFLQTDVVVLSIVLYALLGKLADAVARFLEKLCLRWHPSYA
ncbi:MAG: ABC transporter permease subunit [Synechococcales cyanobacterium]